MKPQDLRVGSVIELLPEEKIVEATTVDITTYHDLYNRDSPNAKLYKLYLVSTTFTSCKTSTG